MLAKRHSAPREVLEGLIFGQALNDNGSLSKLRLGSLDRNRARSPSLQDRDDVSPIVSRKGKQALLSSFRSEPQQHGDSTGVVGTTIFSKTLPLRVMGGKHRADTPVQLLDDDDTPVESLTGSINHANVSNESLFSGQVRRKLSLEIPYNVEPLLPGIIFTADPRYMSSPDLMACIAELRASISRMSTELVQELENRDTLLDHQAQLLREIDGSEQKSAGTTPSAPRLSTTPHSDNVTEGTGTAHHHHSSSSGGVGGGSDSGAGAGGGSGSMGHWPRGYRINVPTVLSRKHTGQHHAAVSPSYPHAAHDQQDLTMAPYVSLQDENENDRVSIADV